MDYKRFLKRSAERRAKMATLYKKGVSVSEIGRRFGITHQRVQAILKQEGVKSA